MMTNDERTFIYCEQLNVNIYINIRPYLVNLFTFFHIWYRTVVSYEAYENAYEACKVYDLCSSDRGGRDFCGLIIKHGTLPIV